MSTNFNYTLNNEEILCQTSVPISLPLDLFQNNDFFSDKLTNTKIINEEDVKTLQPDAQQLENEIKHLEIRSLYKKSKIEDLRCLIERISDEDHYFDRTLDRKSYFSFVKSFNYSSSNEKIPRTKKYSSYNLNCSRTISAESSETMDTTGEEGDGKPCDTIQTSEIDYCLLYWSSAFPNSNKKVVNF